jgi:hypothetical protein
VLLSWCFLSRNPGQRCSQTKEKQTQIENQETAATAKQLQATQKIFLTVAFSIPYPPWCFPASASRVFLLVVVEGFFCWTTTTNFAS